MLKPLISILIPAYNAQDWLADTLRSAVEQTWPNKEIIVVDDGSQDRTAEIAETFEASGVKVFRQKNSGAAATRNKAFSFCKGDYIQWLDADDLINPEKLTSQMDALGTVQNRKILLSGSWGSFMHRPARARFTPSPLWQDLTPAEWLLRKLENNTFMQTASWLVSRELTELAGPWNTQLLGDDDGEYFCRVLLASEGVRFVPNAKVFYRSAGTASLSYVGNSDKKREAQWVSMQLHIRYLTSLDNSDRARSACVKYLQNWSVYFYPERMDIFDQAKELAHSLGGELRVPKMSWKYSWIKLLFGWRPARYAQRALPNLRWSLARRWDKVLYRVENWTKGVRLYKSSGSGQAISED